MPRGATFYSMHEEKKSEHERVHHDNSVCPAGRRIPEDERLTGTGGYRLCHECHQLNEEGR